jgi:hypothetical protein
MNALFNLGVPETGRDDIVTALLTGGRRTRTGSASSPATTVASRRVAAWPTTSRTSSSV